MVSLVSAGQACDEEQVRISRWCEDRRHNLDPSRVAKKNIEVFIATAVQGLFSVPPPECTWKPCFAPTIISYYCLYEYHRGGIVDRTYQVRYTQKPTRVYISLFLPTILGPIYYGPP